MGVHVLNVGFDLYARRRLSAPAVHGISRLRLNLKRQKPLSGGLLAEPESAVWALPGGAQNDKNTDLIFLLFSVFSFVCSMLVVQEGKPHAKHA